MCLQLEKVLFYTLENLTSRFLRSYELYNKVVCNVCLNYINRILFKLESKLGDPTCEEVQILVYDLLIDIQEVQVAGTYVSTNCTSKGFFLYVSLSFSYNCFTSQYSTYFLLPFFSKGDWHLHKRSLLLYRTGFTSALNIYQFLFSSVLLVNFVSAKHVLRKDGF